MSAKSPRPVFDRGNAHQSEILIRDALFFDHVKVKCSSLITYFDGNGIFTWEILTEFDGHFRGKYDATGQHPVDCALKKVTLYYNAECLQMALDSFFTAIYLNVRINA